MVAQWLLDEFPSDNAKATLLAEFLNERPTRMEPQHLIAKLQRRIQPIRDLEAVSVQQCPFEQMSSHLVHKSMMECLDHVERMYADVIVPQYKAKLKGSDIGNIDLRSTSARPVPSRGRVLGPISLPSSICLPMRPGCDRPIAPIRHRVRAWRSHRPRHLYQTALYRYSLQLPSGRQPISPRGSSPMCEAESTVLAPSTVADLLHPLPASSACADSDVLGACCTDSQRCPGGCILFLFNNKHSPPGIL
jgi:hypothetical protein